MHRLDARQTYTQPVKEVARRRVLEAAVRRLTKERRSETLVTQDYFCTVWDHCVARLGHLRPDVVIDSTLKGRWCNFFESRVGSKTPRDLRVAYLAGPEPVNDLSVLLAQGVAIENVWAVEGDNRTYAQAIRQASEAFPRLKLFNSDFPDFLETVPEAFDIVYIDSTKPIPSRGNQPPQRVIEALFKFQRTSDLSVLITNFSQPDASNAGLLDQMADMLSAYFYGREVLPRPPAEDSKELDEPTTDSFDVQGVHEFERVREVIARDLPFYYQAFVTRLLLDWALTYQPFQRVLNHPKLRSRYFSENDLRSRGTLARSKSLGALARILTDPEVDPPPESEAAPNGGHFLLAPTAFPNSWFLWWLRQKASLAWVEATFSAKEAGDLASLAEAIEHSEVVRLGTSDYLDALNPALINATRRGIFLEGESGLFCDLPFEYLIVELLTYQIGYPSFPNIRSLERYSYKAQATEMNLDCITLDRCRYLFDWIPPLDTFAEGFRDPGTQLASRVCMDAIRKHIRSYFPEVFRGANLVCVGDVLGSEFATLRRRESLIAEASTSRRSTMVPWFLRVMNRLAARK
jgi:hypothetical protein